MTFRTEGNFEGRNILNLPKTIDQCAALRSWNAPELHAELKESRRLLLAARNRRVRPAKDDKILVSWNALMIDAMARAAGVLREKRYVDGAIRAAEFILCEVIRKDGRLLHTWRNGRAKLDAYLDDYAYLANALVTLYEMNFDERWIESAVCLVDTMLVHFRDPAGGFFYTADDHETLIARHKDYLDSSVPSGNGMAAMARTRLGNLCARKDYLDAARATVDSGAMHMERCRPQSPNCYLRRTRSLAPQLSSSFGATASNVPRVNCSIAFAANFCPIRRLPFDPPRSNRERVRSCKLRLPERKQLNHYRLFSFARISRVKGR